MASITSLGIGSGLDITSLVSQLVKAEGDPATTRLNNAAADRPPRSSRRWVP